MAAIVFSQHLRLFPGGVFVDDDVNPSCRLARSFLCIKASRGEGSRFRPGSNPPQMESHQCDRLSTPVPHSRGKRQNASGSGFSAAKSRARWRR